MHTYTGCTNTVGHHTNYKKSRLFYQFYNNYNFIIVDNNSFTIVIASVWFLKVKVLLVYLIVIVIASKFTYKFI